MSYRIDMDKLKDTSRTAVIQSANSRKPQLVNIALAGHLLLLHKKSEKIVAALFLVTDYMTDNNPIRHRIQHLGVDVMSFVLSMPQSVSGGENEFVNLYIKRMLEIASLLEIAFLSEKLTEMNFRIISDEIGKTVSTVERIKKQFEPPNQAANVSRVFSANISRGGKKGAGRSLSGKLRKAVYYKGHGVTSGMTDRKNRVTDRPKQVGKDIHIENEVVRAERRDLILNQLSGGSRLAIRDFLSVLTSLSEKTVQRELVSMVNSGVLKKEGERRWSKYYIANVTNTDNIKVGP